MTEICLGAYHWFAGVMSAIGVGLLIAIFREVKKNDRARRRDWELRHD